MAQLKTDNFSLANKHILLGVGGGIAAYKACELVRLFQRAGAQVRVVMTEAACKFVTPLTMQALSGNEVHTQLVDYKQEAAMGHIALARWADALVIAPASASLIARLANGEASDLLSAIFLATDTQRIVAPSMNKEMWLKKVTQQNIGKLEKQEKTILVAPGAGWQACGETGPGRLADLQDITAKVFALFRTGVLAGKRVVITAGATREPLDLARFIGNYSSGKMGYALAHAAVEAGAHTTLISGQTEMTPPEDCQTFQVETAKQMFDMSMDMSRECDVFIGAAAVADLRPKNPVKVKPEKDYYKESISVEKTEDILGTLGANTEHRPKILVGFAAQSGKTSEILKKGGEKLQSKNADIICVNAIPEAFGGDENEIHILQSKAKPIALARGRKEVLARKIIQEVAKAWQKKYN